MKSKDNQQNLGDVVKKLIEYYGLSPKLDEINIGHVWDKHMSNMIIRHTRNLYLNKKTLIIEMDSAALRSELSYGKEQIKNMINKELGKQVVEEVIVR
ncbi:MAG: DUF721 domain-containing protein [Bacteroidota bacterium]